jgi:hypothetical protein
LHAHVVMSTCREELKTLSFAFEAYGSRMKNYRPHIENSRDWEANKTMSMRCVTRDLADLLTSFSQLVHRVMESSNSICTASPQIIPNHNPWISDAFC